jgi:hypothetical protein
MSAQVHEVGHNLGLSHSGQGSDPYGDRSGMMVRQSLVGNTFRQVLSCCPVSIFSFDFLSIQGYSYGMNDAPQMCFNPSKSWKLGWYSGQRGEFDGSRNSKRYFMVGVVDYDDSDNSKRVVVKVVSGGQSNFYIGYNRKRGFNGGTQEAGDQIVVVEAEDSYKGSNLVGKLSVGGEKTLVQNYKRTGKALVVRYSSNGSRGADVAIVDVFLRSSRVESTQEFTANSIPNPTPQPTPNPTPKPRPTPLSKDCGTEKASFVLSIMMDRYPEDISWELQSQSGSLMASGGSYTEGETLYQTDKICLERNKWYEFTLFDSWG